MLNNKTVIPKSNTMKRDKIQLTDENAQLLHNAEAASGKPAEALIVAAIMSQLSPVAALPAPTGNLWACAWHPQTFGHVAYFSEDHKPLTALPAGAAEPDSHGICAHCFEAMTGQKLSNDGNTKA